MIKPNRLGYIGKENDVESGLGDFGVRKYDDAAGRFLSIDPLWEKYLAWSPYHYCGNNPIMGKDPSGLADFFNTNGTMIGSNGIDDKLKYFTNISADDVNSKYGGDWNQIIGLDGTELSPNPEALKKIKDGVYKPMLNPLTKDQEHGGIIAENGEFFLAPMGSKNVNSSNQLTIDLHPAELAAGSKGLLTKRTVHSHPANGVQEPNGDDYPNQKQFLKYDPSFMNSIIISNSPRFGEWVKFYNDSKVTLSIPANVFFEGIE